MSWSREFLQIFNGWDRHCFANGGVMDVAIYGVDEISAGNNDVAIEYIDDLGGPARVMLLPKWNLWGGSPNTNGNLHEVYRIRIL
ncbi:beta/gamma crystallin domain-containing protein [Nonomuraea rubra]|uniref:beta/gamma crystallin domain-containing protein n=1 Tax=Nonomuraea rubra TaxID=46180 RepID=UPI0033E95142